MFKIILVSALPNQLLEFTLYHMDIKNSDIQEMKQWMVRSYVLESQKVSGTND